VCDHTNYNQHNPDDGHCAEELKVALIHLFDRLRAERAPIMARSVPAIGVDGVDVIAKWVDAAAEPLDMARTHRTVAPRASLRALQSAAGELTHLTWHTAPAFHPVQPRDRCTISPQACALRQRRSPGHRLRLHGRLSLAIGDVARRCSSPAMMYPTRMLQSRQTRLRNEGCRVASTKDRREGHSLILKLTRAGAGPHA
jgi:hypothetical protein